MKMKRRTFLKDAAWATATAIAAPSLASCIRNGNNAPERKVAANMSYREDGSFTLMQLTDTHYISGDSRSKRALECVEEALDNVKPDLVIHTGDILFGKPDIESALEILSPISDRGIPFAVALGNHDSQFGSSREDVFAAIRSLKGCINLPPKEGVYGCSNDVITLGSGNNPEKVFYIFDSMDAVILKGEEEIHSYDYIRHNQIAWYRDHSKQFTDANQGSPIESLAFFHIPLCEFTEAHIDPGCEKIGNDCEPPCPSRLNSGLLAQFREMGDVQAIVSGHDHDCDYVLKYGPMFFIYGRYSGCDTVYNNLGRDGISSEKVSGCRLFTFKEGESGFHTCIRLFGGNIQNMLYLNNGTITRE